MSYRFIIVVFTSLFCLWTGQVYPQPQGDYQHREEQSEPVLAPPEDGQGYWQTLIMLAIAAVFFYFILWRPEQKRRKQLEKQRSALKKGDRVTAMGIVGVVARVQEHTVILRMVDGSKIEVLKGAINEVLGSGEGAEEVDSESTTAVQKS